MKTCVQSILLLLQKDMYICYEYGRIQVVKSTLLRLRRTNMPVPICSKYLCGFSAHKNQQVFDVYSQTTHPCLSKCTKLFPGTHFKYHSKTNDSFAFSASGLSKNNIFLSAHCTLSLDGYFFRGLFAFHSFRSIPSKR